MSGTSLDGLDVALCRCTGSGSSTKVKLLHFATIPYSEEVKERIRAVFAKSNISFQVLCELNPWIALLHADMILACLRKWKVRPQQVDVIASHGQTVFHSPRSITQGAAIDSTFQIGDGDHLAVKTGIITLSDFRQKHIAAGGEGAPLAMYGDFLLFSKKGEDRVLLNIGGIGNFTFLPASAKASDVLVTDTGPGNTLIDQYTQQHFNQPFDRDAKFAYQGSVNQVLLAALKDHPFFGARFPKTTGPELFNLAYVSQAQSKSNTIHLTPHDVLATLTRFSADTISEGIKRVEKRRLTVYVSGGGAHNPLLRSHLTELLQTEIHPMSDLGIPGDAKEAILFAVLANESLAGGRTNFGRRSRVPSVSMGKVSFPL